MQQANYYQKLYYHKVGTARDRDRLAYERPDQKEWGINGTVTEDGDYLIINVWQGAERKNRVFYQALSAAESPVIELLPDADASYGFIGRVSNNEFTINR